MKTHTQKVWPLIVMGRIAGTLALIAAMANLLGFGKAEWKQNMLLGLLWLILATLEEITAKIRDVVEYDISGRITGQITKEESKQDKI